MENKQINEMTNEDLLRQQLELLAERSANEASVEDLPQLALAMVEIYKVFPNQKTINFNNLESSQTDEIMNTFNDRLEKALDELGIDSTNVKNLSIHEKAFAEAALQTREEKKKS